MWTDDAGNLIGYVAANASAKNTGAPDHRQRTQAIPGTATRVMAHMDELSMIVKRVESDGTLHLTQLGTMYPGNFGLGPVAVLGDNETLTAVLALGSEHTTQESSRIWETKPDKGTGHWTGITCTSSPAAAPRSWPRRSARRHPRASTAASDPWSRSETTSAPTSSTTAPR